MNYWVKCPFLSLKVTSQDQLVHREPISANHFSYLPFYQLNPGEWLLVSNGMLGTRLLT